MTSRTPSSRFARNAVANWTAFAFTAVVTFFLSPYVIEHLGATRYGVWSLLGTLVGYFGLLDLGIRQSVNRYVAHHQATGAHEQSSAIASAAIRIFGVLGILAILSSGVLAYFASILFNIPDQLVDDTKIIIVLGGVTAAMSLMVGVLGGVMTGVQRFDVNCYLEILVTTVRTVAIVLALREGYGLVALACIQLAVAVLQCVAYSQAIRKVYAELRIRLRADLLPQVKTLLSFGATLSVVHIFSYLASSGAALAIAAFLPIEALTFYAIAGNLCLQAGGVASALSHVMTPHVSALTSAGSNRVGEEIVRVARYAILVTVPITATFWVRGESFISLWMGPAYGPASGEILRILAITLWLGAARWTIIQSLVGMAQHRMLIPGFAVEAACSLALCFALVQPLGILGAALGILVPNVLMNMSFIPRCLAKAAGVRQSQYFRESLTLPTLACAPFALASIMIEKFAPASGLAIFFIQTILILPLVPLTAWFLCFTPQDKERIGTLLRKFAGR